MMQKLYCAKGETAKVRSGRGGKKGRETEGMLGRRKGTTDGTNEYHLKQKACRGRREKKVGEEERNSE